MRRYVLRRLLVMAPVLIAMLLITFLISRNAPGDPVYLSYNQPGATVVGLDRLGRKALYVEQSKKMGMDLPIFYFEMSAIAYPDTLNRIVFLEDRAALTELTARYGNWEAVSRYFHAANRMLESSFSMVVTPVDEFDANELRATLNSLPHIANEIEMGYHFATIDSLMAIHPEAFAPLATDYQSLKAARAALDSESTPWKSYVPSLRFHGFSNQFHHWLMDMLRLDFGNSYLDRRPVRTKIGEVLPLTLLMGVGAYAISFMIAVWVGLFSVRYRYQWQDHAAATVLFLSFSVPSFVMCMLALTFFCGPQYLNLFPVAGLSTDGSESWPFWYRLLDYLYHLTLPTLVYSIQSITGFSRQMRIAMIDVMEADYIRTARAKGLGERDIVRRHALRNSLLPVVNSIARNIPDIIVGAVLVETIFSLPGMGNLVIESLFSNDHPVVVAIFAIFGLTTVLANLFGDVLYALVDPRISFTKS